jgi:hypothetical protein
VGKSETKWGRLRVREKGERFNVIPLIRVNSKIGRRVKSRKKRGRVKVGRKKSIDDRKNGEGKG